VCQAIGRLAQILGCRDVVQNAILLDQRLDVTALDELHHQVVDFFAVLGFHVHVVGADDVLVVQSGHGLRFDVESLENR
jgi:hypothetical protein